jgi:cytochrome P450
MLSQSIDRAEGREIVFDRSKVVDAKLFEDVKQLPHELFVEWSQKRPFYVLDGGWPLAVFTRLQDCKVGLEDFATFSSVKRPWPGLERFRYFLGLPVITDNDPPNHTRLRRLMAPAFSPRRLAAIEEGLRGWVNARVEKIAGMDGGFDAVTDYGRPLTAQVLFGLLLGLPEEDWGVFLKIAHLMSGFNSLTAGSAPPKDYVDAFAEGRAYCERLVEERRRNPCDDVVSALVAAHDEGGRVNTEEMFSTMFIMYVAGQGGVANTTGWALWRLCRHPEQLKLLREKPELLSNAIDEGVRIDSNAYCMLRHCTKDMEFDGLELKEGMPVIVMTATSNFDPDRYPDPLKFDITRAPQRDIVTFGHGVHHCIGMALARLTGRIAVGAIVEKFPKLRLEDSDLWPALLGGPKERGCASVPLRFD